VSECADFISSQIVIFGRTLANPLLRFARISGKWLVISQFHKPIYGQRNGLRVPAIPVSAAD
jgi:hypothetical protein